MRGFRALLIGGAVVVLVVIASWGVTAGADPKGTLAIVNGVPGSRVDVCLDGAEIKSGLAYGKAILRSVVDTGATELKIFGRDPRTCRGSLVARRVLDIDPGEDLTVVVTKRDPKVVVFVNDPVFAGEIPPNDVALPYDPIYWRNASEVPVNLRSRTWAPLPEVSSGLAADPVWTKGDEGHVGSTVEHLVQLRATRPGQSATLASKRVEVGTSHRYEWILVGTEPGNLRFVLLDRAVSSLSL